MCLVESRVEKKSITISILCHAFNSIHYKAKGEEKRNTTGGKIKESLNAAKAKKRCRNDSVHLCRCCHCLLTVYSVFSPSYFPRFFAQSSQASFFMEHTASCFISAAALHLFPRCFAAPFAVLILSCCFYQRRCKVGIYDKWFLTRAETTLKDSFAKITVRL